MMIAPRIRIFL